MDTMTELFALADYAAGSHVSVEVDVPDAARGYKLDVARATPVDPSIWPDANQTINAQVELFIDGEWLAWGAFMAYGGIYTRRTGEVGQTSQLIGPMRDARPGRRLRVTLTLSHAMRTRAWIEVG